MMLSVRELQHSDIDLITSYWLDAGPDFMKGMGVDLQKIPSREEWIRMLMEQLNTPIAEKQSYCIIWEVNGEPVGHSNINRIVPGEEAYMHLHVWKPSLRQKGMGTELVQLTLPYFFTNYQLKNLYCEPYALNPAPNRTLEKAGFTFVKQYVTTPGWINFEQPVNRWVLRAEDLNALS